MIDRVLVPVDHSEQAERAFDFAIEAFPDAELTVLYVLDLPATGYRTGRENGPLEPDADLEVLVSEATDFLDDYVEKGRAAGVSVTADDAIAYERGKVARAIIDYADEAGTDHIVIGSHGRTGASRVLLGSVAETVTRRAPVPVTVVR